MKGLLNILALAAIVFLAPQAIDIWKTFGQPLSIEKSAAAGNWPPPSLLGATPSRYSNSAVNVVLTNNLFRSERKPYTKPPQVVKVYKPRVIPKPPPPPKPKPVQKAPPLPKPSLPPPKLSLEGVVMVPGRNIAILVGNYPKKIKGSALKRVSLKKKIYNTGDIIGEYQITMIQKDHVLLTNTQGNELRLDLESKPKPRSKK